MVVVVYVLPNPLDISTEIRATLHRIAIDTIFLVHGSRGSADAHHERDFSFVFLRHDHLSSASNTVPGKDRVL